MPKSKLKKELSLLSLYTIATGATLSSGFFLLPGLAVETAGPAVVVSYILAAIPMIPAMYSMIELSTAMPRAGGAYYFLDRSLGPIFGMIGGLGTWLALSLKTTFALVGMGAYVSLLFPDLPVVYLASGFALFFGTINLFGAKKTGSFQTVMVISLLTLLVYFFFHGLQAIEWHRFDNFWDKGADAVISTAGFVYISYMGLTKVASIAEEVKRPERDIPLAMMMAFTTALLVYVIGNIVLVGVVPASSLYGSYTPVALAAEHILYTPGKIVIIIAAILAFSSVANAGILSSSRYPLAMSRDHLFPPFFQKVSSEGSPRAAIYFTVALILLAIWILDVVKIAKLASSFQLLMFAFLCISVIVMRESGIDSYDPGYRSPLYPWMQIFGIIAPFWLIAGMGWLSILFTTALILGALGWYFYYAQQRVKRTGAIFHVLARLGKMRFEGLDRELRGILKEKGLREQDPYDELIASAMILEAPPNMSFLEMMHEAANKLAPRVNVDARTLEQDFLRGTKIGATPVEGGIALPHVRLSHLEKPEVVIVRSVSGICVERFRDKEDENQEKIHAAFCLASPGRHPNQHLRILAQIAAHVERENFLEEWLEAKDEQELKEILLRNEGFLSLVLDKERHGNWIGQAIKDLPLSADCLIALIRRNKQIIVPRGHTILEEGDRLTIVGKPKVIQRLKNSLEG